MMYIFDCEVFAYDWLFVFKDADNGECDRIRTIIREIKRKGGIIDG